MTLHDPSLLKTAAAAHVQVRPARPTDAEAAGRVIFEAFSRFQAGRGFEPDFPGAAAAIGFAAEQIADPNVFAIVATRAGEIIGANFLSEGDPIRGVGPIAVRPDMDGAGIGRKLMYKVIERAAAAEGVRLLQDAFNTKSLALYASLGFTAREPLAVLCGKPRDRAPGEVRVRPMTRFDLKAADELAKRVHGFARGAELRRALAKGTPIVLERDRRIAAYMTAPNAWDMNHGVAETAGDLKALVLGAGATGDGPLSFLLPIRGRLFGWALGQGFRIVKPMTLMTRGSYVEPAGATMPSVLY